MNLCGAGGGVIDSDGRGSRQIVPDFHCGGNECSGDEDLYQGHHIMDAEERPMKAALDSIQQTLDDYPVDSFSTPSRPGLGSAASGLAIVEETPTSGYHGNQTATPSPNLLNPLTSDWKRVCEVDKVEDKELLCPLLDNHCTSPSFDVLMNRLEQGFTCRLISGPSSCLAGESSVRLYTTRDRTRLCLASLENDHQQDEKKEAVEYGIEMPVSQILRIEVGGQGKPAKSFTIILEKKTDKQLFYDFEIASAIDREVLVSTIMLLLEETRGDATDWPDGGEDQPIPCSPSLEQPRYLKPRSRGQEFPVCQAGDIASHSVIRVVDMSSKTDSSLSASRTVPPRRELPPVSLSSRPYYSEVDDREIQLDFKPSASSTHLGLSTVNSTNVVPTGWCVPDSCTLTLNDLADTCTGIFAMKHPEWNCGVTGTTEQRRVVEEFIAAALGAPNSVYSFLAPGDVWMASPQTESANNGKDSVPKLQNRASLFNAQAVRLRNLRNEMTFAAALKQSKQRMQFVQTVHSFDGVYTQQHGSKRLRAATKAANVFHSSDLLKSVVKNMTMHDTNGESRDEDDGTLYYDSDPEDIRPRSEGKAPRSAALKNDVALTSAGKDRDIDEAPSFDDSSAARRISGNVDEDFIVEIVRRMNNERLALMWHPTQTEKDPNRAPVCVKVWIEAGVYLNDGTFLLPKLTWGNHGATKEPMQKVELLDICRICSLKSVDRKQHPFALANESFYIETQQEIIVFQAQSCEERDRIVYGLKLVVARLASFLMLRDVRAAEEFFGGHNDTVPGEAPIWAQESKPSS